jgi:hypothetical protein
MIETSENRKQHDCDYCLGKIIGYFTVWSDEAASKPNGTRHQHNCAYWAIESPGLTRRTSSESTGGVVWCGLCSGGAACLSVLQDNAIPSISYLFWRQRAPLHYRSDEKILSILILQKDENGIREGCSIHPECLT